LHYLGIAGGQRSLKSVGRFAQTTIAQALTRKGSLAITAM